MLFLIGTNVETKRKLQVIQNKGLRCALNRDIDTSTDELHSEANLYKSKYRREQHLLNFMFDMSQQAKNVRAKSGTGVTTRSQRAKSGTGVTTRSQRF